jgi:putative ABC transport system permease protein
MKERLISNFLIAFEAVLANKIRSLLTALGIIFGVAAVIAMLAIGNGAQQEILEQIKLVGVNNIIIAPVVEQSEGKVSEDGSSNEKVKKFTPGLTLKDAMSIKEIVPGVKAVSPEIMMETTIIKNGLSRTAKLVGVEPSYFEISSFNIARGKMFNDDQLLKGEPVCIIGKSIQTKFFSKEDPIGKMIKVGPHWLKVVGVLEERLVSKSNASNLGIRDNNMDVYTPIKTMLVRYKNRELVTSAMLKAQSRSRSEGEKPKVEKVNYHQLDRLVIQVSETENLNATAEVVARLLERRHYKVIDYEITIPELLLKQQQKTKSIFNIVLGAIAGISLVVGGIGIMNIMLASVLERIKEIGLRLALGAKKSDIVSQFLFEAVMISVSGGLVGIMLGVAFAIVISGFAEIPTIISPGSIIISFGVAATVGLVFGITPARRAAEQDPITSLRYE